MAAIISRGLRRKTERGPILFGVELRDAREEIFVRMVCDGLALGIAFARAGFTSKTKDAAYTLFNLPRIQERANAILEARRTSGAVTLPEVTDMLKRVFAGAHSEGEYSAAHNAAFSLARLYGHVTDRSTLEVIRRPSRDPDAPSEQALASWVESLPALPAPSGPGPEGLAVFEGLAGPAMVGEGSQGPGLQASKGPGLQASGGPLSGAPAEPLGDQPISHSNINWLGAEPSGPGPSEPELFNDINGLATTPRRPENGAPFGTVTEAPQTCGGTELLGNEGTTPLGGSEKGAPGNELRVPGTTGEKGPWPKAEDLF